MKTDEEILSEAASILSEIKDGVGFLGYKKPDGAIITFVTKGVCWADLILVIGKHIGLNMKNLLSHDPVRLLQAEINAQKLFIESVEDGLNENDEPRRTIQ